MNIGERTQLETVREYIVVHSPPQDFPKKWSSDIWAPEGGRARTIIIL